MTWQDAMDKYGSTSRTFASAEIKDISDIAKDCSFKVFKDTGERRYGSSINVNGYADKFPRGRLTSSASSSRPTAQRALHG